MKQRLLIATNNKGKAEEYATLLADTPFELVTPALIGINTEVEETGTTFEENAALKAATLAAESGLLTLADDSGLEVDALGGEPGVRSARYAGENASDAERIDFLLRKLEGIPPAQRGARFRCVIAIARPDGEVEYASGECPGTITTVPKGENGFGYDPVFYLPDMEKTMAELPPEEKNRISHRARAAAGAVKLLHNYK